MNLFGWFLVADQNNLPLTGLKHSFPFQPRPLRNAIGMNSQQCCLAFFSRGRRRSPGFNDFLIFISVYSRSSESVLNIQIQISKHEALDFRWIGVERIRSLTIADLKGLCQNRSKTVHETKQIKIFFENDTKNVIISY